MPGLPKKTTRPDLPTTFWIWKRSPGEEYKIRYHQSGEKGPALVLIHGFGGNANHWAQNVPDLNPHYRVYALDLLGYGYSDKPSPKGRPPTELFNFETWSAMTEAFITDIIHPQSPLDKPEEEEKDGVYLVCNSVGGLVGLQLAVDRPSLVRGVMLLNISLRMLHLKKQPWYLKPFVKALQTTLRETRLGQLFFAQVATPEGVKNALSQAYHDKARVTDELVEAILKPGLEPGAVDVFLDFISYSGGPLPEELLPKVNVPVYIGWGEEDPWEPIALGRAYGEFPCVREFRPFPLLGHCPMDEGPDIIDPFIREMVDTLEQERKTAALK
ncbi:epoxide hydrolase 4-like [Nannochloropsis oceanica]